MTDPLEQEIDRLLREGGNRKKIWNSLKDSEDRDTLAYLLNEYPSLAKRRKFLVLHLLLTAILVIMTLMKLWAAAAIGGVNLAFFLALVVPAINFYILKKLLRFRRTGYQFLFILSIIALFHPENHHVLEMSLTVAMILMSGFLYLRMFPKAERIILPKEPDTLG